MTVLDRAFIKAYQQTGAPPKTATLDFAAPVPLDAALVEPPVPPPRPKGPSRSKVLSALAGGGAVAITPAATAVPRSRAAGRVKPRASATPKAASVGSAIGSRKKTGERVVPSKSPRKNAAPSGEFPRLSVATAVEPPASRLSLTALGVTLPPRPVEPAAPAEPESIEPVAPPVATPPVAAATDVVDVDAASSSPPAPEAPSPPAVAPEEPFRPMLQVDSYAWPAVCTRLTPAAAAQIDQLALGLIGAPQRPRVIGAVGSGRGAGCTTLLLGAARRLAARGLQVVLVDGDWDNPQLARRLGLVPEYGWEEALSGRLPVAEALIESVEDQLALLPWCRRTVASAEPVAVVGLSDAGTILDVLADHFDLVLVDLGALETGNEPASMDGRLDAAVLVHNVRLGRVEQLERSRRRLAAAGIRVLGVVENFASATAQRRAA
ncbi:MAG: hypothetical protein JW809_16965 [Pirellulales bacterium]|nr:hypothetical protein [Pirellulales bacterium]